MDAATLRLNFRDARTVERGLQLRAEAIFDVGNHILSGHFGASSKDHEDMIGQLAARHVIDEALRQAPEGTWRVSRRPRLAHDDLRLKGASPRIPVAHSAFYARCVLQPVIRAIGSPFRLARRRATISADGVTVVAALTEGIDHPVAAHARTSGRV